MVEIVERYVPPAVSVPINEEAVRISHGLAWHEEGYRDLFPSAENLELGARTPESRRQRVETLEKVFALFPRLAERRDQTAGSLLGGVQQMCGIGRALMARPRTSRRSGWPGWS